MGFLKPGDLWFIAFCLCAVAVGVWLALVTP